MTHHCNDSDCGHKHSHVCGEAELRTQHGIRRRDFIRYAGISAAGLAFTPAIASWLDEKDKAGEILKNRAIINGKAKRITILHTADIHGQLDVHDEFFWENDRPVYRKRGGFGTLRTMINALRKENPDHTLVVDGGDCFQGSGIATLTQGQAIVPLINKIRYDLVLPGNWEILYGKKMLMQDMSHYTAAKVCANMFHSDVPDGSLLFPPYQVFNLGGTKIGFIGYNDPLTPIRQSPAYSKGIRFSKPEENLQQYIHQLRENEGCSVVFVISHMGLTQQVYLSNHAAASGVDYILGADTHERVRKPLKGKHCKVTEPGAFGSFISKLDVVVENGRIKDEAYQLIEVDPGKYPEDPEMMRLIRDARKPYAEQLDKVLGHTTTPLVRYYVIETPMDNLITDAMMWGAKPDIAVSNGFRFCPPLVPDQLTGKAEITREYLWSMLPVNTEIKMAEVTGSQIMSWLEKELENAFSPDATKRVGGWFVRFNGMQVTFTLGNEKGKRVQKVLIKGEPLQLEKTYTMAACEREGDPDNLLCRMPEVQNPRKTGTSLHAVMENYLAAFSPVAPRIEGRAIATDAPPDLLTQVIDGTDYQFM